jgi:hypothetical protein
VLKLTTKTHLKAHRGHPKESTYFFFFIASQNMRTQEENLKMFIMCELNLFQTINNSQCSFAVFI